MMDSMNMKRIAAEHAAGFIQNGMKVGLGTGSTAYYAIVTIGERVRSGLSIEAVATSQASEQLARELGIPLVPIEQARQLDITIDGADELDDRLRLIKGGGGALLREKMTAYNSKRLIIIADESKRVPRLGGFPLPVEVVTFAKEWTVRSLEALGADVKLRLDGQGDLYRTDNGNYIADCSFGVIDAPEELAHELQRIPGVVEHGLFISMADMAVIGCGDGAIQTLTRSS